MTLRFIIPFFFLRFYIEPNGVSWSGEDAIFFSYQWQSTHWTSKHFSPTFPSHRTKKSLHSKLYDDYLFFYRIFFFAQSFNFIVHGHARPFKDEQGKKNQFDDLLFRFMSSYPMFFAFFLLVIHEIFSLFAFQIRENFYFEFFLRKDENLVDLGLFTISHHTHTVAWQKQPLQRL